MTQLAVPEYAKVVDHKNLSATFSKLNSDLETFVVPVGFTPDSPDVLPYRQELRNNGSGTPTYAYENLQNSHDYNYDPAGPPQVIIELNDGTKYPIASFSQLPLDELRDKKRQVRRLIHSNMLNPNAPLLPGHVTELAHGGGEGTLGTHARGGRAAAAAMLVEGDAASIEYFSMGTNGDGPWHGQAVMAIDNHRNPGGNSPVLTLGYQFLGPNQPPVTETQLIINQPSIKLVEAYQRLSDAFLLANPHYQHYRFGKVEADSTLPNLLTVWADGIVHPEPHSHTLIHEETSLKLGIKQGIDYREPPRIEILDPAIFSDQRLQEAVTVDHLYVDGLKLSAFKRYALRWSFVNCHGDHYWSAKRSEKSEYVSGEQDNLMALTLSKCTNTAVFKTILDASLGDREVRESKLDSDTLVHGCRSNQEVHIALTQAWTEFKLDHNIDDDDLITSQSDRFNAATARGVTNAIYINCPYLVKVLDELGIIKTVEKNVVLPTNPKETGDVKKITRKGAQLIIEDTNPDDIIKTLAREKAEIKFEDDGSMEITLHPASLKYWNPPYIRDIPFHIMMLSEDFLALNPTGGLQVYFTIDNGSTRTVLAMDGSSNNWDTNTATITYKVTTEPCTETAKCVCTFKITDRINRLKGYPKYIAVLKEEVDLVSTDGKIDQQKVAERKDFKVKNVEATVVAAQQELHDLQQQLLDAKRQLGQIEEDANSDGPTRSRTKPVAISGYTPPEKFDRQFTTLFGIEYRGDPSNGGRVRRLSDTELYDIQAPPPDAPLTVDSVDSYIEREHSQLVKPDILLINPTILPAKLRTTLISTLNGKTGGLDNFVPIEIDRIRRIDAPGIEIKRKLVAGKHAVPLFNQCRLVGVYHSDAQVLASLRFSKEPGWGFYQLDSNTNIPPGLQLYYEYDPNYEITRKPTLAETDQLADRAQLKPQWVALLDAVENHIPPLTDKQKHDIALTAWLYSFRYDKDKRLDHRYADLPDKAKHSAMINEAIGNCGYCAQGYTALCRLFNIPAVEVVGYLGSKGRFFPGPQNHGLCRVYLEGKWVTVEPQLTYLSPGYRREQIPDTFIGLIKELPVGRNYFPKMEEMPQKTIQDIFADLQASGVVLTRDQAIKLRSIAELKIADELNDDEEEQEQDNEPDIPRAPTPMEVIEAGLLTDFIPNESKDTLRQEIAAARSLPRGEQDNQVQVLINRYIPEIHLSTITQTVIAKLEEQRKTRAVSTKEQDEAYAAMIAELQQKSDVLTQDGARLRAQEASLRQKELELQHQLEEMQRKETEKVLALELRRHKIKKGFQQTGGAVAAIAAIAVVSQIAPHLGPINLPDMQLGSLPDVGSILEGIHLPTSILHGAQQMQTAVSSIPTVVPPVQIPEVANSEIVVESGKHFLSAFNIEDMKVLVAAALGATGSHIVDRIRYRRVLASLQNRDR